MVEYFIIILILGYITSKIDCNNWDSSLIKAVYITGKEVFSFKMMSYMDATAGSAYTDMNVVDARVNLTVGCIEVVFVTKFLYAILVSILINYLKF